MWILLACSTPTPPTPPTPPPVVAVTHPQPPTPEPEPPPPEVRSQALMAMEAIDAQESTCLDGSPGQQTMTRCVAARATALDALVHDLEGRLAQRHPTLDLRSAFAAHKKAEFAWLDEVYKRDGSMWPMVRAGHRATFLRDRVNGLAGELCDPPPSPLPSEVDCYGVHGHGLVLCPESTYDHDLNELYTQLLSPMEPTTAGLFQASQRAWIKHRDVETPPCVAGVTPHPARVLRVRQRVEQLRSYSDAFEIGG